MSLLRTNIEIDSLKLEKAKKITGLKTAKALVDFALARLDASSMALNSLISLSGKVHFRKGYSYKKDRA